MHAIVRMARRLLVWLSQHRRVAAQGLTEYALILVLIAVVVVGALTAIGNDNRDRMEYITCNVQGANGTPDPSCP